MRYLRTGTSDPIYGAWPGDIMERASQARDDLRGALASELRRRTEGFVHKHIPGVDTVSLTRSRVERMIRGLFPRAEQEVVLAKIEKSIIFLTSANIESVLFDQRFDGSAWILANLYLASTGADLLSPDAPNLAGVSEETSCYVSMEYFAEKDPFADFVVHEVAHIFHNCKRNTLGLPETRAKEWLLNIEFRKRETFAYACEAYSCVLRLAKSMAHRLALAEEYASTVRITDDRADGQEVARIIGAAAGSRNGWKVILRQCAPVRNSGKC